MSEAWTDTQNEEYIHQFQSKPTNKIHYQQEKHWVSRYSPMEHLWDDQEDHPNQHKNSHKLCNETGHCFEFTEKSMENKTTTWSEFPNGGKPSAEQIPVSEERNKSKKQDCESHSQGSK